MNKFILPCFLLLLAFSIVRGVLEEAADILALPTPWPGLVSPYFFVIIKQFNTDFYPTLDSLKSEVVQKHQTISLDKQTRGKLALTE